jgi:putative addiction module killer protein
MILVRKTAAYDTWYAKLRDQKAKARIDVRIRRLELGNPGTAEPVGEGVSELKIDYGPGYRVYFVQKGKAIVILLCGGDKSTQAKDIKAALKLAKDLK